jgi:hypothetical protein
MGHAIVYCFKCQIRLSTADLEKGGAIRLSNHVTCRTCAPFLLAALPPADQKYLMKVLSGGPSEPAGRQASPKPFPALTDSTRTQAVVARERMRSSAAVRGALGLALALVLVGLVVWIATSSDEKPVPARGAPGAGVPGRTEPAAPAARLEPPTPRPPPPPPAPPAARPPPSPAPRPSALESARRAREFVKNHPDDLAGQVAAYRQAIFETDGSPVAVELSREFREIQARVAAFVEAELSPVEQEVRKLREREEFGRAAGLLKEHRARHALTEWTLAVDKRIRELGEEAVRLYDALKGEALEARRSGATETAERIVARVRKWGVPRHLADLEAALKGDD